MAREAVDSRGEDDEWQNFLNSWMGETWSRHRVETEWTAVGDRLALSYKMGEAPAPCVFLTAGVDVQQDHLVFVVCGWGERAVGYVVEYGICHTWEELKDRLRTEYRCLDGTVLPIHLSLIDSRHRTDEVDEFCVATNQALRWVWPSMGAKPGTLRAFGSAVRTLTRWHAMNASGRSAA